MGGHVLRMKLPSICRGEKNGAQPLPSRKVKWCTAKFLLVERIVLLSQNSNFLANKAFPKRTQQWKTNQRKIAFSFMNLNRMYKYLLGLFFKFLADLNLDAVRIL